MRYKVINTFPIGGNTAVTIEGNGKALKNDMLITGTTGESYRLISVAMVEFQNSDDYGKTTELLVAGDFREVEVIV